MVPGVYRFTALSLSTPCPSHLLTPSLVDTGQMISVIALLRFLPFEHFIMRAENIPQSPAPSI